MQANGEETKVVLLTAVTMDVNPPASADTRGKHRILAELKHLEQETRFLEDLSLYKELNLKYKHGFMDVHSQSMKEELFRLLFMDYMLELIRGNYYVKSCRRCVDSFTHTPKYYITEHKPSKGIHIPFDLNKEELEELEKTVKVSAVVQELLRKIESNAEPLLPITHGPVNPFWDRWFEGPPDSRHCKCWIL